MTGSRWCAEGRIASSGISAAVMSFITGPAVVTLRSIWRFHLREDLARLLKSRHILTQYSRALFEGTASSPT